MSGRSSNQVNNLRAMFEQNKESTSPPSRGRSPAGLESISDINSRPISKVRTSFIAVERSGQMGPSIDTHKSIHDGESNMTRDNGTEPKIHENGTTSELPKIHSNGIIPDIPEGEIEKKSFEEDNSSKVELPNNDGLKSPLTNHADVGVGKSTAEDKDDDHAVPVSGVEERNGNTDVPNPAEDLEDLGVVMKGASFEQEGEPKSVGSGETKVNPSEDTSSSPKQAQLSSVRTTGASSNEQTNTKKSVMPKQKSHPPRPSAISTKRGSQSASTTATGTTSSGPLKKSPKTPISPKVVARQLSSKTTSPKQPFSSKASSNTSKEYKKPSAQIPSKISGPPKTKATTIAKPGQTASLTSGNPTDRVNPTSPTAKPRPKSPTRPLRLPAGATAPTASSAAKLGEIPPSRSPSRASATNTGKPSTLSGERSSAVSRDSASGTVSTVRKSSRPSLPSASNIKQKPKARASTSSSKASDGSFLARMMRPTQSSASKAHEKVEHGSPPSKSHPIRTKRKSNVNDEEKGNTAGESGPAPAYQGDGQTGAPIAENAEETPIEDGVAPAAASPIDAALA